MIGGGFGGLYQQNRERHQLHGLLIQRVRRQRRNSPILQRRHQIRIDAHAKFEPLGDLGRSEADHGFVARLQLVERRRVLRHALLFLVSATARGFHSTLAPEVFTTSPHLSPSVRRKAPNASPDNVPGSAPTSASRFTMSGSLIALVTASISAFVTSGGTLAGATRPNHDDASKFATPASTRLAVQALILPPSAPARAAIGFSNDYTGACSR